MTHPNHTGPGTRVNSLDACGLARVIGSQQVMERAGTCAHPLRLVGGRDVINTRTGELLSSSDDREITVNCGNRRASVCTYCSTLYKYDAYNLVAAGLRGGKSTSPAVAEHPRLFVTVTAPSFGPVHQGPDKKTGRSRLCTPRRDGTGCFRRHAAGDRLIGTPINPVTYDYPGHVLFNALASRLWSETLTEVRRALAALLGVSRRELPKHAKLEFAKVAEYQARGIVHFHAVARLDGPNGPASPPPTAATSELLDQAIRDGVARALVPCPDSPTLGARAVAWGQQIDIRPITPGDLGDSSGLADTTVARYIAKYATKSAESAGVELPPLACRGCKGTGRIPEHITLYPAIPTPCPTCRGKGSVIDLDLWNLTSHVRTLIDTCWQLGALPELAELGLRRWAHMLGFRGHFATKSRTYSTTFAALRAERAAFTANQNPHTLAMAENPDILVINHWAYAGQDNYSRSSIARLLRAPGRPARAAP
jgi:hypothetical protein